MDQRAIAFYDRRAPERAPHVNVRRPQDFAELSNLVMVMVRAML